MLAEYLYSPLQRREAGPRSVESNEFGTLFISLIVKTVMKGEGILQLTEKLKQSLEPSFQNPHCDN